jgi:[ribosomal protein S18]-alanine N-acetyltransferase
MIQILSSIHAKQCSDLHGLCFDKQWSQSEFDNFFVNQSMLVFGYWDKHILVSLLCLSIIGNEAEIYTLCTHPDYRGQKIASHLLQSVKQECSSRLVTHIFLDVAIDNILAIECYKKQSFKVIHTRKNYYRVNNHSVDALMMHLEL